MTTPAQALREAAARKREHLQQAEAIRQQMTSTRERARVRVNLEARHALTLKAHATAAALATLEGQPVPEAPAAALSGISAADLELALQGLQQRHAAALAAAAGCDGAVNAARYQWAVQVLDQNMQRYEAIAEQLGPLCGSIAALAELAKTPVNLSRLHVPALRGNTRNSDLSLLSGLEVYGPHVERARAAVAATLHQLTLPEPPADEDASEPAAEVAA
jgi:hypothetical protein